MPIRTIWMAAGGVLAVAFGAYVGLEFLFPAPVAMQKPPLVEAPPLQPIARTSVVVAPLAVAITAIRDTLEANAPRDMNGNRSGITQQLPINANITYQIQRGPLAVTGRTDGLNIATTLTGSLQATGTFAAIGQAGNQVGGAIGSAIGMIGGDVGRQIGELAGKTFDQKAEVHGSVSATSRPAILPAWRIAPNLTAQATISDVSLPIGGLRLSVASELKPLVDKSVRDQVAMLEARIRNDASFEQTARGEWAKICHSFPLGISGTESSNLYLEITPTRVVAAQPRIDATNVNLLIGVEAQTRVVPSETKPTCPFPAQIEIVPQLTPGSVKIGVPIDVPFTTINKLLDAQLTGKTFPEDHSGSVDVTVKHVELAASGDRLLISLLVRASDRSLFSIGAEATVNVWGRPLLDQANQIMRLTDIEYDVSSGAAFGLLGAAANAAAPYLKNTLADKAVVDLKPFAADAQKKIEAVLNDFQKSQAGVQVSAKVNALRLVGIAFDSKVLRIIAEADGDVNVAVTSLKMP